MSEVQILFSGLRELSVPPMGDGKVSRFSLFQSLWL